VVVIRYALDFSHPERYPLLIQELLELAQDGKMGCVSAIIELIADLYQNGDDCRYIKALGGSLFELKKRAKDGGARVYYFRGRKKEFILCHVECKKEDTANARLINSTFRLLAAYQKGELIYQGAKHEEETSYHQDQRRNTHRRRK
jgi:phage-related protein